MSIDLLVIPAVFLLGGLFAGLCLGVETVIAMLEENPKQTIYLEDVVKRILTGKEEQEGK